MSRKQCYLHQVKAILTTWKFTLTRCLTLYLIASPKSEAGQPRQAKHFQGSLLIGRPFLLTKYKNQFTNYEARMVLGEILRQGGFFNYGFSFL